MSLPSARSERRGRVLPLGRTAIPFREVRFWLVQGLVVGITLAHASVEFVERNGELTGFIDGVHHLPVPLYIVPVLLAGFWYGLRGGLFTGLVTMTVSIPNLGWFHREDFAWFGEALANVIVLSVGVVVAYMVERVDESRAQAEANSERLRTLWDVADGLARQDDGHTAVSSALERLVATGTVEAAGFASHDGVPSRDVITTGDPAAVGRIRTTGSAIAEGDRTANGGDGVFAYDVATSRRSLGMLLVACADGDPCAEDSVVFTLVAAELGEVVENIVLREEERSRLQAYSRAVTIAQERERQRIARDLHDGPTQSMIVLSRGLDRLARSVAPGSPVDERANELKELVQETRRSIQQLTQALRPPVLDDLGLVAALRSLADRRTIRGAITVDVAVHGVPRRLDPEAELAAYRIAQEALTNVERHAEASAASVRVDFTSDGCVVVVADEGAGFDPARPRDPERFGLVGMRERAELVGGTLQIESAPGAGTTVTFTVPTP